MESLVANSDAINQLLARYGVKFGLYKNNTFVDQLFPFDPLPRFITAVQFMELEFGLAQRVEALNLFLKDIYTKKEIVKDGVIPPDFVYSSSGFLPQCDNFTPPGGVFAHIAGIDLVQARDNTWYVLEDNLRIPSGASYPLIARKLSRRASPQTFKENHVVSNDNYAQLLRDSLESVNPGGLSVILTPGRYNAAFFEHSYLAEMTGFPLVMSSDLFVDANKVFIRTKTGSKAQVGAIYRRISDEFLDPLTFRPDSLIGVPGIMSAYLAKNLAIVNSPGNGVADDKGIYYFVPSMIEYYLNEKPILHNAPTYLPFYDNDREYCLENLQKLVIKDVAEAGGYGVVFGRDMDEKTLEKWRKRITDESRRFILQEVIDFIDLPIIEGDKKVYRKADLRAYVVTSATETKVWHSGLTRFSRVPDSFVVNSSQGGGFKDTWILSQ
ncbi:MAG: circularly permuted type 2 ATP-grasp protein [Burkholderiales bacterium]|nr:circularly permuted type 2 ATP-grasp protein [Burkholderiales bacterium]